MVLSGFGDLWRLGLGRFAQPQFRSSGCQVVRFVEESRLD